MRRYVSHSEANSLHACQARHDFAYVGRLAGSTLKKRHTAMRLQEGSAFGAAAAALHLMPEGEPRRAFHEGTDLYSLYLGDADVALSHSLAKDAARMWRKLGVLDLTALSETRYKLRRIVAHYAETATLFHVEQPDFGGELRLATALRLGKTGRRSPRWGFEGYLDGVHTDEDGRVWIVDFKLRDSLSEYESVANDRQWRRYAWAWREVFGYAPAGFKIVERVNGFPEPEAPVKRNKDGRLSKLQACKPETYRAAVREMIAGDDHARSLLPPAEEERAILAKLTEKHDPRHWQKTHTVMLRAREIDEAGRELASTASLVGQLERGELYPVRNAVPMTCRMCSFRDACPAPEDADVVDVIYERTTPKRLRPRREEIAA